MDAFLRQFVTHWRSFDVVSDAKILLAVSGGVDSNALLGAVGELRSMSKIANDFRVAHFDHRIREKTDEEKNLVGRLADRFGMTVGYGEASEKPPTANVEEWARQQRYEFLVGEARNYGAGYLITAHHKQDRVETFFLNLLRGAGAKGLSSMRDRVEIANDVTLLRPMAQWAAKEDLISFCERFEIGFVEDKTNYSCEFRRNEIRQKLMPVLRELDVGFDERVIRSMDLLEQTDRNIEFLFDENKDLTGLIRDKPLRLAELNKYPRAIRSLVIKKWVSVCIEKGTSGPYSRVEAIVCLAESRKSGNTVELGNGYLVKKADGMLRIESIVS